MVIVKTAREISKMMDACRISANALRLAGEYVKPGVTTWEIDRKVREYIEKQGATPSFLGYGGFIGNAVQTYVEARSYSVVRDFVGHGVGAKLHEDPSIPNFGRAGRGVRLLPGMTIAIEPMVCQGSYEVDILDDDWTTVTVDGKLSAHFENTVAITPDGPKIMTIAG